MTQKQQQKLIKRFIFIKRKRVIIICHKNVGNNNKNDLLVLFCHIFRIRVSTWIPMCHNSKKITIAVKIQINKRQQLEKKKHIEEIANIARINKNKKRY